MARRRRRDRAADAGAVLPGGRSAGARHALVSEASWGPPAERFLDDPLGNLWRGLVGDEAVFREEFRIGLGGSTFTASVARKLTSYDTETDYQALLPAGETVREIAASAGGSLTVEVQGSRIRGRASYAIAAEFARWVETMGGRCGT